MKIKSFVRKSKRHGLIAESLCESISVRLESEIPVQLQQLLRTQISAMLARSEVDLLQVKFTPKSLIVKALETQDAILNGEAIRTELRKLVTAIAPAPQTSRVFYHPIN